MPDKKHGQMDKAANASEQLSRYRFGMSPMIQEIFFKLPSLLTRSEWEEMTGFSEWQDPRSR